MLTVEMILNLLDEKEKEQYEKLTPRAKDLFHNVTNDTILLCGVKADNKTATDLIAFKYDKMLDVLEAEELGNLVKFYRMFKRRVDIIAQLIRSRS